MSEDAASSEGAAAEPPMDRRSARDRRQGDRRVANRPVSVERRTSPERREGPRRAKRSMNRYDMEEDVLEFINAINRFKASSGRAFPTWSEVLGILRGLGYEKRDEA
jgi:hypothetical protein